MRSVRAIEVVFLVLCVVLSFVPEEARAFPEMIRHGYVNCTSCHVSPTGGGVLNEYGRELSKELLSTWTSPQDGNLEHHFAYGLIRPPQWLILGGDVRTVYVYRDDEFASQGKTILMQADLEAAFHKSQWTGVFTLGHQDPKDSKDFADSIVLRRHYLQYDFSESLYIRAGKFIPAFGINTPDHVNLTRRGVGLGAGLESYNLEMGRLVEKFSIQGGLLFGRPDQKSLYRETGLNLLSGMTLGERSKVGLSYLYGRKSAEKRHLFGPYGLLGITERLALLTEIDFQVKSFNSNVEKQVGAVSSQKLSYELAKGFWGFLQQEWGKSNFSSNTLVETYGLGMQFFPRPHFDFNLSFERQKMVALSPSFYSYGWLMSHFYF